MASLAFRAGGPVAIAALAGLFVLAPGRHDDHTVSASQDQDTSISATLKDQVDLAVTVYNSNIALVRDVRQVALPSGALDLSLLDIAASVPASVSSVANWPLIARRTPSALATRASRARVARA